MVEQLVFRKKACGNFINNIANVFNTFVKENDEVQVEERLAADKAKRIVDIKEAVKEEEAAAELAERNSLLAQIADLEKAQARQKTLDAQSKLEEAAKELEAFNKLPIAWQNAYLLLNQ
jgi:N-glycosylase/DNA lyase